MATLGSPAAPTPGIGLVKFGLFAVDSIVSLPASDQALWLSSLPFSSGGMISLPPLFIASYHSQQSDPFADLEITSLYS